VTKNFDSKKGMSSHMFESTESTLIGVEGIVFNKCNVICRRRCCRRSRVRRHRHRRRSCIRRHCRRRRLCIRRHCHCRRRRYRHCTRVAVAVGVAIAVNGSPPKHAGRLSKRPATWQGQRMTQIKKEKNLRPSTARGLPFRGGRSHMRSG
jgi:hypothetical protein